MQIFVQTTHYVIELSKITHIQVFDKLATIHFVGGTKQSIRIEDAYELTAGMKDKALAGVIRCVNGTGH